MSGRREKILVAMSGGVDSSVAAALLHRQGYAVTGISLRMWSCDAELPAKACCGLDQAQDARAAAGMLGFPYYVVDAREVFDERVLKPSWNEYARGRTPNPCVHCNERFKFDLILKKADALGAEAVATGHYARVVPGTNESAPLLLRGKDRGKDQSYFLFTLTQDQLARTRFPLGEFTKDEVRALAREVGLPNADRPESQDACLIPEEGGFAEGLRQRFGASTRPGTIVDPAGNRLGEHEGIHHFTVGQRRGLGIALGKKAYVIAIHGERDEVVVSTDEEALLAGGLEASGVRWLTGKAEAEGEVDAQIRYRHRPVKARLQGSGEGKVRVHFAVPQRAVTPGQAVVFFRGDTVLGGGWIERALKNGGQ
jgi:tRNA-specific 2-thiouridylase